MTRIIDISIFLILFVLFSFSNVNAEQKSPFDEMVSCNTKEDCAIAPEVFKACFHYCKDKECEAVRPCPFFNRNFKLWPACAANVPCRDDKAEPKCENHICVR